MHCHWTAPRLQHAQLVLSLRRVDERAPCERGITATPASRRLSHGRNSIVPRWALRRATEAHAHPIRPGTTPTPAAPEECEEAQPALPSRGEEIKDQDQEG